VFGRIDASIGAIDGLIGAVDGLIGAIDGLIGAIDGLIGAVDGLIGAIDGLIGAIDGLIGAIDGLIGAIDAFITSTSASDGSGTAMRRLIPSFFSTETNSGGLGLYRPASTSALIRPAIPAISMEIQIVVKIWQNLISKTSANGILAHRGHRDAVRRFRSWSSRRRGELRPIRSSDRPGERGAPAPSTSFARNIHASGNRPRHFGGLAHRELGTAAGAGRRKSSGRKKPNVGGARSSQEPSKPSVGRRSGKALPSPMRVLRLKPTVTYVPGLYQLANKELS
jgi:hypothetical protein